MSQSKHGSHESLSPEECERLVLSPPPVPLNPVKLREFLSVNRAVSAKYSLHSVHTSEGSPPMPRHASVAWSRSEFDSKFKQYESEMKSASTSEDLPEVHLKRISLEPTKVSERVSPSAAPISVENSETTVAVTPQKSTLVPTPSPPPSQSRWRQLFCCVPSRTKIPEYPPNQRPIIAGGDSDHAITIKSSTVPEAHTKITKSSKWTGLFKKPKNVTADVSTNGNKKSTKVELRSVKMVPQAADERLKSPAPALLITRHETNSAGVAIDSASDNFHFGGENGVAGYHVNLDDRMSESVHSQDSQQSDDSYLEPVDQANPGENLLGQPPPDCIGKKCLVLDLDETLVHSSFKPVENADFTVTVEIENVQHEVSVCKRPHLETFIETVGPLFEVVMFTASLSKYADPVCDRIDPAGHFKHRLFRESCVCFKSNYIKHLAFLGRDLDQICIIDNSPISFYFHRQNALQIVTWFDDPTDTALLDLIPYLRGVAEAPSVIEYVSQYAPPPTAAKAQPDISPWLFGAPGLGGWGGYNDEDEEECETGADGEISLPLRQEGDEELGGNGSPSSSPHNIITMAPRPSGEAVTTNT
nr:Carboxy terminal domain RNA polymerase II [Hymenolepis microstoma]